MNDLPSNAEPGPDNVLDKMVEHFTARIRSGETPSISEYQARCPELGSEIHELLSSAAMIEGLKKQTNALLTNGPGRFEDLFELERLGEYRIVRELGRGGMGIVLEAVHESLGRRVAIKVLPHRLVSNEKHVERFTREARAAATLHHNNIVSVFGVGHSDGYYFYVMEYIDGCGLDQIMRGMRASSNREPNATLVDGTVSMEEGEPTRISHDDFQLSLPAVPIDPDRFAKLPQGPERFEWAARIVAAIADALEYAHGQGVLHRDIKPGNLLLDPAGRVWLTDFGLVKNLANPSMTMAGDVIGTPQYMAPESFEGQYHVSSETYCLGVTLYELVTLQPVCREGSAAEMIRRVTSEIMRKPRQIDARIPRDLATIIEKSVAREPSDRYQTAGGMHRDLNAFLNNHPISARPASIPKRVWLWSKRNPWQAISAGLVGLVAILATAGFVSRSQSLGALSSQHELLIEERDNTRKARDIALEQFERAEANVDLSLELFDEMFKRMVTLGTGQRDGFSFDGFRELTGIETAISEKDAEYLESMLSFIGRFADENSENTEFAAKAAKSYRRVANIYHLLGKYPESRDTYRRSIRMYESLLVSSPDLSTTIDQAQTANELGLLTLGNGDYRNASKVFTKTRKSLETCTFRNELPVQLELIRTLNLMGSSAPIVSTEALIRDRDTTADTTAQPRQKRRGIGYRNRVSRQYRQMSKANEVFVREAITLVNRLIAAHGESPELVLERARSLVRLAELQYWLQDKPGSLQSKESAVVDLAHLTDELPDSPEYRALLAQVYAMPIGQSNEDSLEELLKASDITTVLCEDFPGNTDYLQMDAEVNYQLSQLRRDLGAPDLATDHLQASHEALRQVSQRAPRNVQIRIRYYAVTMELAESMFEQKRFAETRDFLLEKIRETPRSGIPRGTPAGGNRSISAQQHRLLARCYEQLGDKIAARRASRKAQQINQAQRDKAQREKAQREKALNDGKIK